MFLFFEKNYFFHSELRIKKMKAILHILKTSDSSHWSSLASDVFGFLIFAFSMQILNSEWLGVKRDFLLKIVRIRDCEQCKHSLAKRVVVDQIGEDA